MYIRSLKNLRAKDTMDVLLSFAEGEARKPAITATRTLQTMPASYLTSEVSDIHLKTRVTDMKKQQAWQ